MKKNRNNSKMLIVAGQFSLFLGILGFILNIFFWDNNYYIHFVTGILLGLSLVLNLSFLIGFRKNFSSPAVRD